MRDVDLESELRTAELSARFLWRELVRRLPKLVSGQYRRMSLGPWHRIAYPSAEAMPGDVMILIVVHGMFAKRAGENEPVVQIDNLELPTGWTRIVAEKEEETEAWAGSSQQQSSLGSS